MTDFSKFKSPFLRVSRPTARRPPRGRGFSRLLLRPSRASAEGTPSRSAERKAIRVPWIRDPRRTWLPNAQKSSTLRVPSRSRREKSYSSTVEAWIRDPRRAWVQDQRDPERTIKEATNAVMMRICQVLRAVDFRSTAPEHFALRGASAVWPS